MQIKHSRGACSQQEVREFVGMLCTAGLSPGQAVGNVGMSPFPWSSFLFLSHLQGVCLGMQLAVVEFSRNVLGWEGKCLLKNFLNPWRAQSLVPVGHWEPWRRTGPPSLSTSWGALIGTFIERKQAPSKQNPREAGTQLS